MDVGGQRFQVCSVEEYIEYDVESTVRRLDAREAQGGDRNSRITRTIFIAIKQSLGVISSDGNHHFRRRKELLQVTFVDSHRPPVPLTDDVITSESSEKLFDAIAFVKEVKDGLIVWLEYDVTTCDEMTTTPFV